MFPFTVHSTGPCDDDGLKVDNHPADDEPTEPNIMHADFDGPDDPPVEELED